MKGNERERLAVFMLGSAGERGIARAKNLGQGTASVEYRSTTGSSAATKVIRETGAMRDLKAEYMAAHYYQQLYDIEEKHWWARGMRAGMDALLLPVVAKGGKLRTLDLGCGTGYLMTHLESHYPIAGHVTGLDVAEIALAFCRKRDGRGLILADAADVPLESASFDLITCTDMIQHLSDAGIDQRAVREMARLLKPGGILYLRTNTKQGVLHGRHDLPTVRALLEQNGFELVRATHLNMSGSMVATLRRRLKPCKHEHHHHDEHGHSSHELVITTDASGLVSKLKYLVTRLEAAVMGLGINLPFGHSCAVIARKI